jgi:Kef-type K+ transport system membrane component KefB
MNDVLIGRLLVDIGVIVLVAQAAGFVLERLHQPAVLGEIIGGIALGPTLLGAFPGNPSNALFTTDVQPPLNAIGNVGLVLFMFVAGLELEQGAVRGRDRTLLAVSGCAIALPFGLGLGIASALYPYHQFVAGHRVGFVPFAMFLATALSITAFPVLVRIVHDRGMRDTPVGQLAIASAAVQDVAGWMLLAASLAALRDGNPAHLARIVVEAAAFGLVLVVAARPALRWLLRHADSEPLRLEALALVVALLAGCAAVTQLIGLHSVIGAFALGVAFPRGKGGRAIGRLRETLGPVTMTVLLPVYFLVPGLRANLRGIDEQSLWQFAAILACACAGKLAGSWVPARLTGLTSREAGALGALLNARGLIELVVLTVGLSNGILDQGLFSVLVLVAVVTTLLTGPLLTLVQGWPERRAAVAVENG